MKVPFCGIAVLVLLLSLVIAVYPARSKPHREIVLPKCAQCIGLDVSIRSKELKRYLRESNAKTTIEVRIEIDGVRKDFTIEEFKEKLGFAPPAPPCHWDGEDTPVIITTDCVKLYFDAQGHFLGGWGFGR